MAHGLVVDIWFCVFISVSEGLDGVISTLIGKADVKNDIVFRLWRRRFGCLRRFCWDVAGEKERGDGGAHSLVGYWYWFGICIDVDFWENAVVECLWETTCNQKRWIDVVLEKRLCAVNLIGCPYWGVDLPRSPLLALPLLRG